MKTIRIKNHTYNFGTLLCMILLFVTGLLVIADSALNFKMLLTWDSGGVLEYQGNYQFSKKRHTRNVSYVFLLDNGDIIQIPHEYIIDNDYEFDNSEPLKFRYLAYKSIFHLQSHTGVAITTFDNSCTLLHEESMKSNITILAIVFLLLGISCTIIPTLPIWFNLYIKIKKTKRNVLRKKRKHTIKH